MNYWGVRLLAENAAADARHERIEPRGHHTVVEETEVARPFGQRVALRSTPRRV